MSWSSEHAHSERFAAQADSFAVDGHLEDAYRLYKKAAQAEQRALSSIPSSKAKTIGITLVSAVALYYKAREWDLALSLAYEYLARQDLPSFAQQQVEDLVATVWGERARAKSGIEFLGREVLVSLSGGEVAFGAAPLDLVVQRVEQVQKFLYRIAEFVLGRPHRKHGGPEIEILDLCRPWILQAPAGSYQFAVRVQVPKQTDLFRTHETEVRDIANKFLGILDLSAADPSGQLANMVPDTDYRATFINMARNLAPDGKLVERVDFRPALAGSEREVSYISETRESLSAALRPFRKARPTDATEQEVRTVGVLRAVDLEKDWLKVLADLTGDLIQVIGVGDSLDDVLGPMVNRRVIVDYAESPRARRLIDIQPEA